MNDAAIVLTTLGALVIVLLVVAEPASGALVRSRARRLPMRLAPRMEEEWLGESNAIASRPGKLAFAIALTLTRRQAFAAPGEDSVSDTNDRLVGRFAAFNGRKTLLILPTVIFGIAAYGASFLIPIRYMSSSLILVRPREISTDFVPAVLPEQRLQDKIGMFTDRAKSRASLLSIISQLSLDLGRKSLDDSLKEMRDDTTFIRPHTGESSLVTQYIGPSPEIAQKVTMKLTEKILEADGSNRKQVLLGTRDFIRRRLDALADRLTEKGDELNRERAVHGPEPARLLAIDYEQLQSTYEAVFAKYEDVQLTIAMENEQKAETFVLLDPPALGKPLLPNRIAITGLGAIAGLVLGSMALFGLDRRQRRTLAATSTEG